MSEALDTAKSAVEEQREKTRKRKDECLASIAHDLPDRLDAVAKRAAQREPDIAKKLGREGIQQMRSALRSAATDLGMQLIAARDDIEWSTRNGETVHSSLFPYLYGPHVDQLTEIIAQRGFDTEHHGVLPQDLYERRDHTDLTVSLSSLHSAERALQAVLEAEDQADVEDLWD